MVCRSCGTTLAAEARFCSNCGSSQASADEERRIVTALFADIVGFTGLAEHRDPEEVKQLVDASFAHLAKELMAFGGVVDKIVGDQIVALFGAPVAHEDDAERAVRASLRMQANLADLGSEVLADLGPDVAPGSDVSLHMRIAVNTGEVLVGSTTAGGDYTAMGDVMNSASRLLELAEPGQVLVGVATKMATGDAIRYEPVGHLPARGRDEPIDAWVAVETVRPPGAHRRRAEVFVGREQELGFLEAQATMAIQLKTAQLSIVLGEAGMGKTRLIQEASDRLATRYDTVVVEGRCVPYGEANVWWPVAEILRQLFGMELETEHSEAESLLRSALSERFGDSNTELQRWLTALMHAFGYETVLRGGERTRNRSEVLLAVTHLLEYELRERAVVVVLSDMHWAADAVWELIHHVLNELARTRLIVMMSARSIDRDRVYGSRHGTSMLNLGPLSADAANRLLHEVSPTLPVGTADQLVDRSGGNPYFLEELAGLVQESGDRPSSGRPGVPFELSSDLATGSRGVSDLDELPETLRGLVAARLDALAPHQRSLIEDASVLGRSGAIVGLATLARESRSVESITDTLAELVADDLLTVDGPRYEFKSDLVRDVAYGTLTKAVRIHRHFRIARYMESIQTGKVRNSVVVAIADQYRAAAQLSTEFAGAADIDKGEIMDRALYWLDQAGYRAIDVGELAQAERWFDFGVGLAPDDESLARFLYGRAKVRSEIRDLAGARSDLDRLEQLLGRDPVMSAKSLLVRGDVHRAAGDLDRAAGELREAADRLAVLGVPDEQAYALRLLGMTEVERADHSLARQALESSRMVAAKAGDRRGEAWAIQSMAWHAFVRGRLQEADDLVAQAVDLFAELGDRGGLAWSQGVQAWIAFHLGNWDNAAKLIDAVLPEARRRGDPWAESIMLNLTASLALWSGRAEEAQAYARDGNTMATRADDNNLIMNSLALEGRALVSLGRVAEGTALLERAFVIADRDGDLDSRRVAVISNCASAARLGEPERAIRWAARFDGLHEDPSAVGEADLVVSLALAMLQRGAVDEAASQLSWSDTDTENESIGVDGRPALYRNGQYEEAVGAIAAAAQGRLEVAERRVARVLAGKSTYLDRVYALAARAAARLQRNDLAGCSAALDAAWTEVEGTDDQVTRLLLDLVAAVFGQGDLAAAEQRMRGSGLDPTGWRTVWELAARKPVAARQ